MGLRTFGKPFAYALQRLLPRRQGCLILGHHSIGDFDEQFTVSSDEFEWQLQEIARQGLKVIMLSELEKMMDAGHVEDKTVVLTFDDGRDDNYTHLFPIVQKYKVPATIFSITGFIGKIRPSSVRPNPMLSEEQMREMQESGLIDFQPHTVTHPKLTQVSLDEARKEVSDSRLMLERMFSKPCPYFAYPYGRRSLEIEQVLKDSGIRLACTGLRGFVTAESNRMALPRSEVRRYTSRGIFKSVLKRGSLR